MSTRTDIYTPADIEPKWQDYWLKHKTFKSEMDPDKKKVYVLDMFPYPSGAGLHVGHPEGYTATDIYCRYKRMCGYNVLHPMGWDAFGLPAEQYAISTGTHPAVTTQKNVDNFRRQIRSLGFSYDWDREVDTTDVRYYKWTQWIFLQLYKKGLAYISEAPVNWCPALGTVLSNEEVINGRSERGDHPVERRPMKQWMLRITSYAEQLLDGLEGLDWPEGLKDMQRNWIGKSIGADVDFTVAGHPGATVRVYTTRPDTLFGATYMVLAPEHAQVDALTTPAQRAAVDAYIAAAASKSDMERTALAKDKSGCFTGAYAINPVNGEQIPIWISDYVLATYGHGAIMAVPAHDDRDFAFAKTFGLPITAILRPDAAAASKAGVSVDAVLAGEACWTGDGEAIRSANADGLDLNGRSVADAKATTIAWLEARGQGKGSVNYKLRDWLFSRQRYWGEPFPLINCPACGYVAVPEDQLPVTLPEMTNFKPTGSGDPPLARATEWLHTTCPDCGDAATRETNTMPQWAGSCWYYLRYIDPLNAEGAWDPAKEKYWMPVDLYVGGAEHAVLHLLYARFWHHVLYDLGFVSTPEPFQRLVNQGLILGISYKDKRGGLIANDLVETRGEKFFHKETGDELEELPAKMSKSLKNVVNPDDVIQTYGADSLRLYEMFMGPLTQVKPWKTDSVTGVYKFLQRAWRMIIGQDGELVPEITDAEMSRDQARLLHATIKKLTEDLDSLSFNTAISALMVFVNEFGKAGAPRNRQAMETFCILLAPLAPHIAEELWEALGHPETLTYEPWPAYDEAMLVVDAVEILVQLKGKPLARLMMPPAATPAEMEALALADATVAAAIAGKKVMKVIAVPGRLVNLIAN